MLVLHVFDVSFKLKYLAVVFDIGEWAALECLAERRQNSSASPS